MDLLIIWKDEPDPPTVSRTAAGSVILSLNYVWFFRKINGDIANYLFTQHYTVYLLELSLYSDRIRNLAIVTIILI